MLFNSLVFLYLFLPVTYFVFWALKSKDQRYIWLTLTSYFFYGYWDYRFCFLMLLSTVVSYFSGLAIAGASTPSRKRLFLVAPITFDLLLLGFFKYFNFFVESTQWILARFHIQIPESHLHIILPVGISFYTFHTISYIVDCYRGVVKPTKNFFEFSCYVSLFSQLVAGPIVRFRQVEDDLENIGDHQGSQHLDKAWSFFTIGLIKKVILADTIAQIINPGFASAASLSSTSAWLCALGYTYQLYFDFSGYSDMAVGLGYLFNIHIPQNFNSPYQAEDFSDFWRRWHISLSTSLRDYVFIPMGGSRSGLIGTLRNLMITMLIGGLWHGANVTFLIWGGYHGFLLVVNRFFARPIAQIPIFIRRGIVFFFVVLGWVWFRSDNIGVAKLFFKKMFRWQSGTSLIAQDTLIIGIGICFLISHFGRNTFEMEHRWRWPARLALGALFLVSLILITSGKPSPFLYFQF